MVVEKLTHLILSCHSPRICAIQFLLFSVFHASFFLPYLLLQHLVVVERVDAVHPQVQGVVDEGQGRLELR